jgi:hypothetical protein
MFTSKSMMQLGWLMLVTDILLALYCHFHNPQLTLLFLVGALVWGIGIFVWGRNVELEKEIENRK